MAELKQTLFSPNSLSTKQVLFDHIINVTFKQYQKPTNAELSGWEKEPRKETIQGPNSEPEEYLVPYAAVAVDAEGNKEYRYLEATSEPKLAKKWSIRCTEEDKERKKKKEEQSLKGLSSIRGTTAKGGPKPGISLKYSLIGNSYCYQVTLDIVNFHVNVDVRELDTMEIELGYRNGPKRRLDCSIMTAYRLTPGPDSITRFQCIAVGNMGVISDKHPITLLFRSRTMKLGEVVTMAARALHNISYQDINSPPYAVLVKFACNAQTLDMEMSVPRQKTFSNGAAVLRWITDQLKPFNCEISLVDGELICMNSTPSESEAQKIEESNDKSKASISVYNLDKVISASIVGGLVNVITTLIPQLRPGDLFRMLPNYFDGSQFLSERYIPMSITVGDRTNKTTYAVFRVIKVEVEFATNNATNKMTILAVPIVAEKPLKNTGLTPTQELAKDVRHTATIMSKKDQENTAKVTKAADTEDKPWYEYIPEGDIPPGDDYLIDTSRRGWDVQGLNSIAGAYWSSGGSDIDKLQSIYMEQGYDAFKEYCNNTSNVRYYYKTPKDLGERSKMVLELWNRTTPGFVSRYMWPIIAAHTYKMMMANRKRISEGNTEPQRNYYVNLDEPDKIENGTYLRIPNIASASDVDNYKEYADLFIAMGKLKWKKDGPGTDVGRALVDIGIYLGGSYDKGEQ